MMIGCGPSDPLAAHRVKLDGGDPSDAAIVALSQDAALMAATEGLFRSNCAACHTLSGSGLIGPNLTDEVYLGIRRPLDLFRVISDGRHAKGMPAWESKLDPGERLALAAYTAQLRGRGDGSGKAPQGDPVPPWETFLSDR